TATSSPSAQSPRHCATCARPAGRRWTCATRSGFRVSDLFLRSFPRKRESRSSLLVVLGPRLRGGERKFQFVPTPAIHIQSEIVSSDRVVESVTAPADAGTPTPKRSASR